MRRQRGQALDGCRPGPGRLAGPLTAPPAALGAAAPSLSRPLGALGKSELGPHGATLAAEKAEKDSQGPGGGCGSDWMQLPPSGTVTHSSCSLSCCCGSGIKAGVVGKGGPRGQVSLARHTFTGCLRKPRPCLLVNWLPIHLLITKCSQHARL